VRQAELIRYLVLAAQREGNRRLTAELEPLGLTPSQAEVIRIVADHQPLTLSGLGELLICESGTNPSRLVDRLVTAGLLSRATESTDRRRVVISLTDAGETIDHEIRTVEDRLYTVVDEVVGSHDLSSVLGFLWALCDGRPAGAALKARLDSQPRSLLRRSNASASCSSNRRSGFASAPEFAVHIAALGSAPIPAA
jgi:MarR family transcriptional regulator, organic hydroperoxide resistance regulator